MRNHFKTLASYNKQKLKAKRRRSAKRMHIRFEHSENLAALETISTKFALKLR